MKDKNTSYKYKIQFLVKKYRDNDYLNLDEQQELHSSLDGFINLPDSNDPQNLEALKAAKYLKEIKYHTHESREKECICTIQSISDVFDLREYNIIPKANKHDLLDCIEWILKHSQSSKLIGWAKEMLHQTLLNKSPYEKEEI